MSDTIRILASPRWQFFTDAGAPASGYYVYTYEPGTTTNKATYQDTAGSVANTNPIVLNARGEATIFWDGLYKVSVYTGDKDVDGVLVYTEDNYGVNVQVPTIGNYNLVNNGDMETATADPTLPDSWTVTTYTDGTAALDSVDQYSGAASLKFASVGTGGGYAESNFFAVQEGKNLAINWAMKSSVADVRNVVEIIWYTSAQVQVSTTSIYDDSATNTTSWTAKISKATPPSTARFAKIRITGCHSSDATVGNTHFDNVIVSQHADGDGSGLDADLLSGSDISTAQASSLAALLVAEIELLDGATLTTDELNTLDVSANAVTGFTYSNIIYVHSTWRTTPGFDIGTNIGAAWESVGPTGSGATNIWTAMDAIPSGAAWVGLWISASGVTALYAQKNGTGGTNVIGNNVLATGAGDADSGIYRIPVDANNAIEMYFSGAGTCFAEVKEIGA